MIKSLNDCITEPRRLAGFRKYKCELEDLVEQQSEAINYNNASLIYLEFIGTTKRIPKHNLQFEFTDLLVHQNPFKK